MADCGFCGCPEGCTRPSGQHGHEVDAFASLLFGECAPGLSGSRTATWPTSYLPQCPAPTPRRRVAMCSATMIVGTSASADGGSGMIEASATEKARHSVHPTEGVDHGARSEGPFPSHRCPQGGGAGRGRGLDPGAERRRRQRPYPCRGASREPRVIRVRCGAATGSVRELADPPPIGRCPPDCGSTRGRWPVRRSGRSVCSRTSPRDAGFKNAAASKQWYPSSSGYGPHTISWRSGGSAADLRLLRAVAITWKSGGSPSGWRQGRSTATQGWSARFVPTPGRSIVTGLPNAATSAAGPMPDR